jgi:hypothetical protein
MRMLLALLAVLVAGCGGGGGGPSVVASTDSFPLAAAYVRIYTTASSQRFTVSGNTLDTNKAISGSGTATVSQLTPAVFESRAVQRRTQTVTGNITVDNTNSPLAATSYAYLDSNYSYLGSESNDEYKVVVGAFTIPATVKVNGTGTFGTLNRYSNRTKTTLLGTEVYTYVVEADTSTTALLKIITTSKDRNSITESVFTSTYRIYNDGNFKELSEAGVDYTSKLTMTLSFE